MGKVKKPRQRKEKKKAQDNPEEEEHIMDSKENAIQVMLDQLQSVNVEEKYCGLQTFATLIESQENLPQLIEKGLVRVVAPLLLDAASSVRNSSAGALRNLSAISPETCDTLMEQDVMTSLTCFFHEFAETWTPDLNLKTKDEDKDTIIQVVNLLWNMCESSELAIKSLYDSRVLDIICRYLDLATFGTDVVTAVLQCLFVVIEDNQFALEKIKTNCEKVLEQLLALEGTDTSILLVRTLAAGVTINLCHGNITALPVNVITQIIRILANSLSVDHRMVCSQLSNFVPLKNSSGKIDVPKGKAAQVLENQLKSVSQMLDAQQSSVEIVANICSCEDGEDTINDDSSDSESVGDDDICTNGNDLPMTEDKLPPELLEALISLEVFDKVWARTQPPAENILLILREYEGTRTICKKLQNLQSGALLCVNNMLSSLPIENLGGVDGVYKIWVEAGKLVFKTNSDNSDLIESATAAMRASLDKIKSKENLNVSGAALFKELALTDIEMMLSGIRECQVPEIRSNLIRMIGLLGLLLVNSLNETTSNVICVITDFIIEQAHKENEVWVLAEAIDTVMDLFSEDETDPLAAKVKLDEKLSALAPILKNKARQQKKLPKEYKVLVTTAASNLPRFIKYIAGRVKNIK